MTTKLRSTKNISGLALVLIAALMLSACGGNEPASSNAIAASDQSIISDTSVSEDTAPTEPEPTTAPIPEVAVVPAEVPEPGSDEEMILAQLEKQVRAMNTLNPELFLETCTPDTPNPKPEQILHAWTELGGWFYQYEAFTNEGFNARNVEFRTYKDDTASSKFNVYNYDELVVEGFSFWWAPIDGDWYSTSATCTGATGR